MQRFAFIDIDGNPIYTAMPSEDGAYIDGQVYGEYTAKLLPPSAPDDMSVLSTLYYYDNNWRTRAERPNSYSNWDKNSRKWVADLDKARAVKTNKLNMLHANANLAGFTYAGKQIALDPLSLNILNIINSFVMINNELPENWINSWRAMDDTFIMIPDVATWKKFYNELTLQIVENLSKSEQLKKKLASATNIDRIEAITWNEPAKFVVGKPKLSLTDK